MSAFKRALEAVTEELRMRLPRFGFERDFERQTDAAYRRLWYRHAAWKTDVVEIVYRRGGEIRVLLNLIVVVPSGSVGVSNRFASRGVLTPRIPHPIVLQDLRMRRYARRVSRLLEDAMPWFSDYSTPADCLQRVPLRERNGPMGGPALAAMVESLEASRHELD